MENYGLGKVAKVKGVESPTSLAQRHKDPRLEFRGPTTFSSVQNTESSMAFNLRQLEFGGFSAHCAGW
jgi:hypothetical protein